MKGGVVFRLGVSGLEFEDKRHERLGHEASAIKTEMAPIIGSGAKAIQV